MKSVWKAPATASLTAIRAYGSSHRRVSDLSSAPPTGPPAVP